jgi:hypothetical protein
MKYLAMLTSLIVLVALAGGGAGCAASRAGLYQAELSHSHLEVKDVGRTLRTLAMMPVTEDPTVWTHMAQDTHLPIAVQHVAFVAVWSRFPRLQERLCDFVRDTQLRKYIEMSEDWTYSDSTPLDRIRVEDDEVSVFGILPAWNIDAKTPYVCAVIAVTPRCTRDQLLKDSSVRIVGIYVGTRSQRFMRGLWMNTTGADLERKSDK